MTGTFITVEGIDGAGKTLAVQAIEDELDVITTHEPSQFWTGKQVRRALQEETPPFTDFFLFLADRHYHIENFIKPELEKNNIVVSDRFADSTLAYNQVQLKDEDLLNNLSYEHPVHTWMERVMEPWIIEPDLIIYLNITVDTALERANENEKYENREMLEQVKANYDKLSLLNKDKYVVIDGEQSKQKVREQVLHTVKTNTTC